MEKKLRPLNEIDQLREDFIARSPSKAKAMERSLLLTGNFGSAEARAEMNREFDKFVAEQRGVPVEKKPEQIWDMMSDADKISSLKKRLEALEKNRLLDEAKDEESDIAEIALSLAEVNRYDINRIDGFGLTQTFRHGKNIAIWTKNPYISCRIVCKMLRASVQDGYFFDPSLQYDGSANPLGDLRTRDYFLWEEDTGIPSPYQSHYSDRIILLQSGIYLLVLDGGCTYYTSTPEYLYRIAQAFYVTPTLYDSTDSEVAAIGTAQGEFHKYCRMTRLPTMLSGDFGLNQAFVIDGNYGPYEIRLKSYGTYIGAVGGAPSEDEVSVYLGHDQDGVEEYEEYDSYYYNFIFVGNLSVIKIA